MSTKTASVALSLQDMKPLNLDQYEKARARALDRVQSRIGERPTRARFGRELGSIATPLDYLALIVFIAALLISSAHIVQYMKLQAAASYHPPGDAGILFTLNAYTLVHEFGAILLAEAAAILFMTMHSISAPGRAQRPRMLRQVSVPLVLALTASTFVFVANTSSGVEFLVSIMPPLFTLGVGLRLEVLIVEMIRRREDVTRRYLAALAVYEVATADPTAHPDYPGVLKQELWAALMSLSSNKPFADAPPSFKHAAARRELGRESWAYDDVQPVDTFEAEVPAAPRRPVQVEEVAVETRPFGLSALTMGDPGDTLAMQSANGHTAPVSASHPE